MVGTAITPFDFTTTFASTNTDVLAVDDNTNLMTLFLNGRWQFSTFIAVQNTSAQDRVLTLRIVNNDTGDVLNSRNIEVPKNSIVVPPLATVPLDITNAPVTIALQFQADGVGLSVIDLDATLTTSGGNSSGGAAGLPSTWEANKAAIRAITGYQHGIDIGDYETGAIYEFDSTLTAADDNDTYLTPGDIVEPDPGRWVKRKMFLTQASVDNIPTKGSNNPVASDGVYATITESFVFLSTADYGVITRNEDFKITSVATVSGLAVTIKKTDDTIYTLGDIITGGDFLKVFGDTLNKAATIKGEIV